MSRYLARSLMIAFLLSLIAPPVPTAAQVFRGVDFPQGVASFADAVVSYNPDLQFPLRADATHPSEALGPPDDVFGIPAEYVSLGNGGSLTLRFVDNALTGSGTAAEDLWIFEIGALVEDTAVAISRDGVAWIEVGTVAGSTSGIDIDPFVPDPTTPYSFVRLVDVATEDFDTGNTAGADIDAVGAISTIVRPPDTAPPVVSVPAGHTAEATGPDGAEVTFAASATDLVDGPLAPTCIPVSGALFALGTTTVTCTATDDAGNTGSAGFTITVVDTTAPEITVPGGTTVEATSVSGAVVEFATAAASDLVDGPLAAPCDAESGHLFPLGPTTVTCAAIDAAGNTGAASFEILVEDTTPPTIATHPDVTAEAAGAAGAAVAYDLPATHDAVDGDGVAGCDPAPGSTFSLGATTVACTATDAADNSAGSTFTVDVVDTTPPTVTVPAGVTIEATGPTGAVVGFEASASDLVDGAVPVGCSPPSDSTFPLGATVVTCTATDAAGNTGAASFTVTVVEPTYGVCPLFDQSKAVKAGAVKPIRVQLCDPTGGNLSSPDLVVHAVGLVHLDGTPSAQVEDAGQANPDHDFRYDAGLAGYVFNLDTDGLAPGTWNLQFTVNGGSIVYSVTFDVK